MRKFSDEHLNSFSEGQRLVTEVFENSGRVRTGIIWLVGEETSAKISVFCASVSGAEWYTCIRQAVAKFVFLILQGLVVKQK